jgi:hypothetical protein
MLRLHVVRVVKEKTKTFFLVFVAFVSLLIFFYARSKYHLSSLDTDEGLYAYGAQEIIRGNYMYRDFHVNKPPGTVWIYVLIFRLLGESAFAIKLSVTLTILATSLFVFLISKKLLGSFIGSLAAFFFLFSLSLPYIHSGQANSEVYMTFFIVMSIYAILTSKRMVGVFISGLLLGIAFMIKTVAISNLLAVVLWLALFGKEKMWNKLLYLTFGFFTSSSLMLVPLYLRDTINDFVFSVFTLNYSYINDRSIISRFIIYQPKVIVENLSMWVFGLSGAILSFRKKVLKSKGGGWLLVAINLLLSLFLIQYLGKGHYHYYIHIVPFLTILCLFCLNYAYGSRMFGGATLSVFVFFMITSYFFSYRVVINTPGEKLLTTIMPGGDRGSWYDGSRQVGEHIKKYVNEGDYAYNLGREGQIYFYSKTRSPSRYLNDRLFDYSPETIHLACEDLAINKPKLVINTLTEPHFSPWWRDYVWDGIRKCGDLKVERKEKYLFAEIWWIE